MISLSIQDQLYTIQNLQRFPISQTSNWSGTFFCYFLQQTDSSDLPAIRKLSYSMAQHLEVEMLKM